MVQTPDRVDSRRIPCALGYVRGTDFCTLNYGEGAIVQETVFSCLGRAQGDRYLTDT